MQVSTLRAVETYRESLVEQTDALVANIAKGEAVLVTWRQQLELKRHQLEEVTLDLYAAGWTGPNGEKAISDDEDVDGPDAGPDPIAEYETSRTAEAAAANA